MSAADDLTLVYAPGSLSNEEKYDLARLMERADDLALVVAQKTSHLTPEQQNARMRDQLLHLKAEFASAPFRSPDTLLGDPNALRP